MQTPLRALALVLFVSMGLIAAMPASAQSITFPSSSTPATGVWTKMTPSTFEGTVKSAVEQCLRDAAIEPNDLLTPERCQKMQSLLAAGQCQDVLVPDGVVHDYMNGRTSGRSFVTRNVKKQLGRSDRALLCELGGGVHAYWYTGIRGQSCNNVGITILVPTPPPPPPAPPPPPKKVCRIVEVRNGVPVDNSVYLSPFLLQRYCPPGTLFIPGLLLQNGSQDKSTQFLTVCD